MHQVFFRSDTMKPFSWGKTWNVSFPFFWPSKQQSPGDSKWPFVIPKHWRSPTTKGSRFLHPKEVTIAELRGWWNLQVLRAITRGDVLEVCWYRFGHLGKKSTIKHEYSSMVWVIFRATWIESSRFQNVFNIRISIFSIFPYFKKFAQKSSASFGR